MRDFKQPTSKDGRAVEDAGASKRTKDEEVAFENLADMKQKLLEKSLRSTTLLHRKMMRLDRGRKTVVISALRELNPLLEGQEPRESAQSVGKSANSVARSAQSMASRSS